MVTILYFAWVREQVGLGEEQVVLPVDVITLADLARWLASRGGGYAAAFGTMTKLRAAVDQVMVALDAKVHGAREIAFFPPVTGG